MGHSKQTDPYELPLFVDSDKPTFRGDFNEAMNKINQEFVDQQNSINDINRQLTNIDVTIDNKIAAQFEPYKATIDKASEDSANALEMAEKALAGSGGKFSKILIVGDSTSKGFYQGSEHSGQGVGDYCAAALGITGENIVNVAVSGSGFCTGTTFAQQVTGSTAEGIDLIVCTGGINDNTEASVATSGMSAFLTACQTKYPDAEVHVFPMLAGYGWVFDNTKNLGVAASFDTLCGLVQGFNTNQNGKFHLHQGCYRWGAWVGESKCDGTVHFLPAGAQQVGQLMASLCYKGGDFWPYFTAAISGTALTGTQQANAITEAEGMIYIKFQWQVDKTTSVNTLVGNLPAWAKPGQNTFTNNIGAQNRNCIIAMNKDGSLVTQFGELQNGDWVIINQVSPAGQ